MKRVQIIIFEGTSSSSNGPMYLTKQVASIVCLHDVELVSFPIASRRKLRKQFDRYCRSDIPTICIGKSLGAVRMFNVLNSRKRWEKVDSVISIDPTSGWHMLFAHAVKAGEMAGKTLNFYQTDYSPAGLDVDGAINVRVKNANHHTIIYDSDVVDEIKASVAFWLTYPPLQNDSNNSADDGQ